jgi:hypothetical protein
MSRCVVRRAAVDGSLVLPEWHDPGSVITAEWCSSELAAHRDVVVPDDA